MPVASQIYLASIMLAITIVFSAGLGAAVLFRNTTRWTHRLFAILTLNLALWAAGVLTIVHMDSEFSARIAITATFIVSAFLPATFYQFIAFFPRQRFAGSRAFLLTLYVGGVLVSLGTMTPFYLKSVQHFPDQPPLVEYGPVFLLYSMMTAGTMFFSFANLFSKLRDAEGIERRQIEHVIAGIFLSTGLAFGTNVLAPAFGVGTMELYGPCFALILLTIFAYSMVRYHLLDIWIIVSRTTVYGVSTAFVVLVFMGSVSVVHYLFSGGTGTSLLTTGIAASIIVMVLQPMKERVQNLLDRAVLNRGYDAKALMERVTRRAAQMVRLDELMQAVVEDIRETVGAEDARVFLAVEKERGTAEIIYSTYPDEVGHLKTGLEYLFKRTAAGNSPISLQEILHSGVPREDAELARQLMALGALLLVPLRTTSGVIGMLVLGEKHTRDIYTQEDMKVFSTVAGPIATAIENARLYRKLEALNLHMERIMANMRGGVIAVDRAGTITTINQEARDLCGNAELGGSLSGLPSKIAEVLRYTLQEGRGISDVETVIAVRESELIPIAISSSAFNNPEHDGLGAMVLIYNMTQIKRLESSVRRADRLTSIGTMAAGMAHEIKNPLQSIKTFSQLLLERFNDADFRRTFAEVVPPEVHRIDTIVTRLLDFARPKPVQFMQVDVAKIIEEIVALLRNQIRKQSIMVNLDFPPVAERVTADEQQIHQVFLNLFLNAIDALKDSGERSLTVRVSTSRALLRPVGQQQLVDSPCVKVSISDTGCGIPPQHLEQIFTPFFTTKAEGSGLGLAVVHGIITEHGGEIDVVSELGVGTTFSITFPLAARVESAEKVRK